MPWGPLQILEQPQNLISLSLGAFNYLSMDSAMLRRSAASLRQNGNTVLLELFLAAPAIFGQNMF